MAPEKAPGSISAEPNTLEPEHGDIKHAVDGDVDIAAAYADKLSGEDAYTKKEATKLRWKIDLRLMGLLWFNSTIGAIDKVTTGTAALYGMNTSLGLDGTKYSWVGSAFYFGYLFWSFPSAGLLQKLPIAKFMSLALFLWGFILIGTGFSNNFATIVALRVLLGILEAPINPGNFLILAMWYNRREQSLRYGLMLTGLSVLFTGPIGYGIGFIGGDHVWRYFFWITGSMTVAWSVVIAIFLPDNPVKAKFVTEREKAIVIDRIRADQTGVENKHFKKEQVIEAFTDPKTWMAVLFQLWVNIPNGGLTNFSPLIINGLGYSAQRSTLITMPTGIIQTASAYICGIGVYIISGRYPKKQIRGIFILGGLVVGMIAAICLYALPTTNLHGRLAALYMSYFYIGPWSVSLSLNLANTAGHTKKVTVNAMVFISYCVSNIIAPQFFKSSQAPLYPLGTGAILGSYCLSFITMICYMAYCYFENKRRDRADATRGERIHEDTDFRDLTDRQNVHFRYLY